MAEEHQNQQSGNQPQQHAQHSPQPHSTYDRPRLSQMQDSAVKESCKKSELGSDSANTYYGPVHPFTIVSDE